VHVFVYFGYIVFVFQMIMCSLIILYIAQGTAVATKVMCFCRGVKHYQICLFWHQKGRQHSKI